MDELAWVAEKDDWVMALGISAVGSFLLLFFILPLSNLLLIPPSPFPYLLAGGIGFLTYKVRTTPKKELLFRKGMRVFEYRSETGVPLKPARYDQIVEFSIVPRIDYVEELTPDSFTLDDYWKTQLVLELRESTNKKGEKIGENIRFAIPGSAMNYDHFLKTLLDWGVIEKGAESTIFTFRIFPNRK
ncbi:MAG: hypothetical protein D6732_15555 [Methanobacteriota archaeon]|nr:MAG: hypothetical protein D6732_15555 [Euryarchaeota archaeon]